MFLNDKNKLINKNKFDFKNAQSIINNKLDIDYYSSDLFTKTKNKIQKILNNFYDIDIIDIYSTFDDQSNLFLNIVILHNGQKYTLLKELKQWTLEDINKIFEISIKENQYIIIQKFKSTNLKNIVFPSFILSNEKKLTIFKISKNAFSSSIQEIDFSNNNFIELEENWINNKIKKLTININESNINYINKLELVELWINDLDISNNNLFQADKIFINNKIHNIQSDKLMNNFYWFSYFNNNEIEINFTYINDKEISINSLSSKKELENYKLFNYLNLNNKVLNIKNWNPKSLSKLKSKIINCSQTLIKNESIFENNYYVEKIYLNPNQETLPKKTFKNCTNLAEIDNVSKIKYIYDYAFDNCINLKYFYIGKGIEFISKVSFININSNETKIIYHKNKINIINNIAYKELLEEIIDIDELVRLCTFNIINNKIEIISFNDNNKIITSSFVEYNYSIYLINKINYTFAKYNRNEIKINVPTFTEFISLANSNCVIDELILPKYFQIKNILDYPSYSINRLILPIDTNNLRLKYYCNNIIFKDYSNIYDFNYDGNLVTSYIWELPTLSNNMINQIKYNKWSNIFKNQAKLEIINKYKNDLIIPFLNEIYIYKKNIKLTNIL